MQTRLFHKVPKHLETELKQDCARKNGFRFTAITLFNIFIQLFSVSIYTRINPVDFSSLPYLNENTYYAYSLIYVGFNVVSFFVFNHLRKYRGKRWAEITHVAVIVFLTCFIIFECLEGLIELKLSNTYYRLITSLFIVSFLPAIRHREKFALLLVYMIIIQIGFNLIMSIGYPTNSAFRHIIFVYFLTCLFASYLTYDALVNTFFLQQRLEESNKELQRLNKKFERQAIIDELTQIYNRRAFDQYMAIAWRSSCTNHNYVSIIMTDIDDFKAFNDTYGHLEGDACLKTIAQTLSSVFARETDIVARYGGEEFVVLTTQQDSNETYTMAEKARQAVIDLQIPNENGTSGPFTTISVGIATIIPSPDLRYEKLIKYADDALYRAKNRGKNRVCIYRDTAQNEISPSE